MQKSYVLLLAGILCLLLIATGCTNTSPAPAATTVPTTATPVATTPPAPSWAGTWNTTWLNTDGNLTVSVVTMTVAGQEVSGNYSYTYPDEGPFTGHLNGTAKGQTLAGMYSESDDDVGYIIFALSADGNSFAGRWVHAENKTELDNSTLFWNGVRMAP
ncbi:MAG: hypothetical protein A4E42_01348 [Methanoregulaceae archaeon PtaU1.Bin222]|nr:MAG: hypothetical protein A4E42_01348 [Methanoregulaceae archaeon PtaU1.Bin222]